ncbi:sugar ABC transporter permease [Microbacterium radiodurans]|uniref:Sugar ABC transporter permease n=1 Tax=Microbacterium radiodurans TaxID=661398 RepID=A0A5J5IPM7_9MICO|nr:sugar ABC transporter permease [Microbacterium radiodurans]KAA9086566.1 sugar ABC transporter permease [Microbacterium radiodurans]
MSTTTVPAATAGVTGRAAGRAAGPGRPVGARRRRWLLDVGWKYLVALVILFYAIFPLLYVVSASLNPRGNLAASNQLFGVFDAGNFVALGGTAYWTWYGNTLLVSGASAIGAVFMGAAAAYAFSRFRFRGRRPGLTALLIIQMFPQALAFVAIFLMLLALGEVFPVLGLNSKIALICVYLGGALGVNTFLMYGFFNTIPMELDESAKIDGATHAQIFWRIIMPLVTPILAVVALLAFIASFGDYIISKIVLVSQENWTLAVGMYQWVSNQLSSNWGLFAAGAVLASIPVLALFLALQRYIIGGLTAGSVKG